MARITWSIDRFLEGKQADFARWDRAARQPDEFVQSLRELGWHLPVSSLRDWLQGRPMSADISVIRDEDGQISGFSEDGWAISYRDFRDGRPTRISARKPPYQVRLAIKSWVVLP